jgi:type I restriction enzyme, S subunit
MSEIIFQKRQLSEITLAIKDGTHGSFRRVINGVPLLSAKNVSENGEVEWNENDDNISEEDYLVSIHEV